VTIDAVGARARPTTTTLSGSRSSDLPRYCLGIINHKTYADLERCLASVKAQAVAPEVIVVIDAEPDPTLLRTAAERHPEVYWTPAPNRGFGAGANAILRHPAVQANRAEFILILNPDVELRSGFAEHLLREMRRHPNAALASGKLLRLDGRTLDSTGILLPRHRRPRDRGSEELDRSQYDRTELLFGVSGAALMIRSSALADLEVLGEVFDEDFFLYHEDSDLSWRANLLGWDVLYVPAARALHGRRWQRQKRFEMARFGYALLFDRPILAGYRMAWRLRRRIWEKRRVIWEKAATQGIAQLTGERDRAGPLRSSHVDLSR